MFSQCPDCQAIFQVSEAHLQAANGNVRCGQCLTIFDARAHRRDDLLDNDPVDQVENESLAEEAELEAALAIGDSESPSSENANSEKAGSAKPDSVKDIEDELEYSVYIEYFDSASDNPGNDLDELSILADEADAKTMADQQSSNTRAKAKQAGDTRRRGDNREATEIPAAILEQLQAEKAAQLRPSRVPWIIGNLLLIVVLAGQAVYFMRNELAQYPQWRPWLERGCALIDCQLAQAYDLQQVEIINRDVRTDPQLPDGLIASTTLINNADFTQPYPLLNLHFSDINGKRLAQRRFTPEEYLSSAQAVANGMPPNLPIVIELKLKDPGKAAVNFEFVTEIDPRQGLYNG